MSDISETKFLLEFHSWGRKTITRGGPASDFIFYRGTIILLRFKWYTLYIKGFYLRVSQRGIKSLLLFRILLFRIEGKKYNDHKKSINQWLHVCMLIAFCSPMESVRISKSKWCRCCGSLRGALPTEAWWPLPAGITTVHSLVKSYLVRFQNVAGSFIVGSKFTSFHLPFCYMEWLLLWSIDKKCWGFWGPFV
jgi:hypothetical protein